QLFTVTPAGADPYQPDGQGVYEIEAENYYDKTAGTGTYASYAWGQREGPIHTWVMQVLPNDKQVRGSENPGTAGPALNYRVNFVSSGTHYIWVRGTGPFSSDHWYNSTVSYGIDGAVSGSKKFNLEMGTGIYENKVRYDYMQWQRGTIDVTSAGEHTVSFWMKADGFKLDKCIITTDDAYTPPSYIQPPESPTGIAVSDIDVSRMTVSWNTTARAYGYRLYYRNATAGDSWSWSNQIELDSSTGSYVFAMVDGDSLHANTAYDFHVAAVGPQQNSHGWQPANDSASGTTLPGGSGGFIGFESADMRGYPILSDGDFMAQGYRWTYEGTSSELSSLGSTEGVFDRACVFYGDASRVYSEAIPGGFGSLSFTIGRHGYPSGGQFVVLVNGNEVARTHKLDWSTYDHFRYDFPGVNVSGDVVITVNDITPANGNDSRGSFDDLRWTGFRGGAPAVPTGVVAAFGDSGLTVTCAPVTGATGYRVYAQGMYPEQYELAATASGAASGVVVADPRITGPMVLRMTAVNDSAESPWSDSVLGLAYHCGETRQGIYAYYYDGKQLSGDPIERVDSTINFASWSSEPAPGLGTDNFSVVWVGDVQAQHSETYTFSATYDDGARLWVNGELLVDDWTGGGSRESSGTLALQAGEKYHLMMQYFQGGGGGKAELRWSSPSTPEEIIPSTQLSTGPSCTPPVALQPPRIARQPIGAAYVRPQRHGFYFAAPPAQAFTLAVYDMAGRLVTHRAGSDGGSFYVPTRHLPTGLYIVRLAAGEGVVTVPLMVR
ncbi:MAG: T9SS type A sorting domain-containing protein, partial [Chitinivibrionales bacterium]|nr:T9SS type A sorting domain-containing protein [Chitinivibrionales bacterium]